MDNSSDIEARHDHLDAELLRTRRGRMHRGEAEPKGLNRSWSSRQLHQVGLAASHSWAGVVAFSVAVAWIAVGLVIGFTSDWQAGLTCTTSIVTVVMLFAIQHLQARDQLATQRKLDEILRSLPGSDNRLISVEHRSDEELGALAALNRRDSNAGN